MRTPLRCDRLTLRVVLLISKCMVKKQQMQWTSRGAHLTGPTPVRRIL